jgi:hypothetical protein
MGDKNGEEAIHPRVDKRAVDWQSQFFPSIAVN